MSNDEFDRIGRVRNYPIPREIMIYAFRYALGRMSVAPSYVVEELEKQWPYLKSHDKALIKREIGQAIEDNSAGMACDVSEWRKVLNWPDGPAK